MSGGSSYKSFMKVLEKWPIDSLKQGRDLGEALRLLFSQAFPSGPATHINNEKHLKRQIQASRKLSDDHYLKQYPRIYKSNFSGLDLEQLKQITSTKVLAELSGSSQSKFKFFERVKNMFSKK